MLRIAYNLLTWPVRSSPRVQSATAWAAGSWTGAGSHAAPAPPWKTPRPGCTIAVQASMASLLLCSSHNRAAGRDGRAGRSAPPPSPRGGRPGPSSSRRPGRGRAPGRRVPSGHDGATASAASMSARAGQGGACRCGRALRSRRACRWRPSHSTARSRSARARSRRSSCM